MPAYHYVAIDIQGREQKGALEADSEKHARELLRARALTPLSVESARASREIALPRAFAAFGKLFKRVRFSSQDLALFTRQFATLLTAGLPVEEALLAVSEQTEKQKHKGLILSVRAKVMEGHTLAHAFADFPDVFSDLFCATIAAGEKSGYLDQVLTRLADYTEQQRHIQQKLTSATIYPAMILLVATGIVIFLLQFVVPKLVSVYGRMKQTLPFMTEVLIAISNWVGRFGLLFLIALVILFFAWRYARKKSVAFRLRSDTFFLRLPMIGYAIRTANTARFSGTLAILSASGVPVLEAMQIAAELLTSLPIKNAVLIAVMRVREGASIALSLKQTTYFSPMSVHMVASGEASGQLETMLDRVARHQENEIVRMIEVSLALFEPMVILLMGGVVLFIVLAVLLPIFQLNQLAV